jgi:polypeptide N-acetylgalactosaminyltransferase
VGLVCSVHNFHRMVNEDGVLAIQIGLIYTVCAVTHVNHHYRVVFCFLGTIVALCVYYLRVRRDSPIVLLEKPVVKFILPLALTYFLLGGFQVVSHNVPSVAFGHAFMDYNSLAPRVSPGQASISIVIPVRDEHMEYLAETLRFIFRETPRYLLEEVILVDDFSDPALTVDSIFTHGALPHEFEGVVKILRFDTFEGLTRAKIAGANSAVGTHILFLDAHCRVGPHYAERMLGVSAANTYKDIIVPQVIEVDGSANSTFGFKRMDGGSMMMFDWSFDFNWFADDGSNYVPVSSGGILLITNRRWKETRYDGGMFGWGGENIEQSFMNWICGGKILVDREARIGHVFVRLQKPPRAGALSHSVTMNYLETNYARGAFTWLDDWVEYFEFKGKRRVEGVLGQIEPLYERLEMRHRLQCGGFDRFVSQFEYVFDQRSLLSKNEVSIQHTPSGMCLTVTPVDTSDTQSKRKEIEVSVFWRKCSPYSVDQRFTSVGANTRIRSVLYERCIERQSQGLLTRSKSIGVSVKNCDYSTNENESQMFRLSEGHIQVGNTKHAVRGGVLECLTNRNGKVAVDTCPDEPSIRFIFPAF